MADNGNESSRLLDMSVTFRKNNVARNDYDSEDQYNAGHANALSTGDEKGKGETENSIGSATDIKERKEEIAKNKYNSGKMYDASNA